MSEQAPNTTEQNEHGLGTPSPENVETTSPGTDPQESPVGNPETSTPSEQSSAETVETSAPSASEESPGEATLGTQPGDAGQSETTVPSETQPAATPSETEPQQTESDATASASTEAPNSAEGTAAPEAAASPDAPAAGGATADGGEGGAAGGEGATEGAEAPEVPQGPSLEELRQIWEELEEKSRTHDPVDIEIRGVNRGGIVGDYKGVEIFIPHSHWSLDRGGSQADVTPGETYPVTILEITRFDTDARRVTGSRRSLLRREFLVNLGVGQRHVGRVTTVTEFGAFVNIGGIEGLLHVSEMSYSRNVQPGDVVKKGDEIEVIVRAIENNGKRISLGHKELKASPWSNVEEKYAVNSVQKGRVVSLTDLGAFVELEPGVEGLLRPREISWTERVAHAGDRFKVGDEIEVSVLNVSEKEERIGLSYKRAHENPWPTIVEKFSTDEPRQATVKEISNKGVVVEVEGVEGFLPRGRMGRESRRLPEMQVGEKLEVRVVEIDPKRSSVIFGLPMEGGGGEGGGGGRRREGGGGGGRREGGRGDRDRDRGPMQKVKPSDEMRSSSTVSSFALGDMLGNELREKLGLPPEEIETETPQGGSNEEVGRPQNAGDSGNGGEAGNGDQPDVKTDEVSGMGDGEAPGADAPVLPPNNPGEESGGQPSGEVGVDSEKNENG